MEGMWLHLLVEASLHRRPSITPQVGGYLMLPGKINLTQMFWCPLQRRLIHHSRDFILDRSFIFHRGAMIPTNRRDSQPCDFIFVHIDPSRFEASDSPMCLVLASKHKCLDNVCDVAGVAECRQWFDMETRYQRHNNSPSNPCIDFCIMCGL